MWMMAILLLLSSAYSLIPKKNPRLGEALQSTNFCGQTTVCYWVWGTILCTQTPKSGLYNHHFCHFRFHEFTATCILMRRF